MTRVITALFSISLLVACGEQKPQTLFNLVPSSESGIAFRNEVENSEDFNIFSYRNFYNGGGVAIGDVNNDGLADVYLISNMASNKLYINKGDFAFEEVTEKASVGGSKAWSTGAVMVDINSDGLLDIYVCNAGYLPEKSDQANELFINNGDLTFTEQAEEYGLAQNGYTTHAAFFDYDADGDLDAYILNNSFMPVNTLNFSNQRDLVAEEWPVRDFLKGGGDKLLRNDNGVFVDVTVEAGIYSSLIGFGLGVTVGDINKDQRPDLYISNDFFERDYLYINKGDGTFSEEIENWMGHISLASMGADMADINNDGNPEIFVSEMLPDEEERLRTEVLFDNYSSYYIKLGRGFYHQYMHNTLQYNNGDQSFSEIAWYSGVAASDWSWGALLFDADNDGLRDLYVCNGTYQDVTNQDFLDFFNDEVVQRMAITGEKEELNYVIERMPSNKQHNRFFVNNGDLTFTESGVAAGFDSTSFSNGAAYGDLDNDGDLDLVVNNLNQDVFVYRNNAETLENNHFVAINLIGDKSNTFALGAKVLAYTNNNIHNAYIMPSRGFQSSVDYKTIFGLGATDVIDSLKVIWPDNKQTLVFKLPVDSAYTFNYKDASSIIPAPSSETLKENEYLTEIETSFKAHTEDEHIDFIQEGLVIKMLSREGPAVAKGDINGDGLDDIYQGGASNQSAQVYIQSGQGFKMIKSPVFESDAAYEDVAASFFDLDQDGDLDLYVGSGGNLQPQGSALMQDRVYLNDGSGNFLRSDGTLPENGNNTAVILPFDVDLDGDIDLLVGNRSIPINFGVPPESYIYENMGDGTFKDATLYFAPFLGNLGMITDAKLVDLMGNDTEEIVLTGEWMSPVILKKNRSKYEIANSTLQNYSGWWYAVEADDVDGDGDQDLILGNRGENFYFSGDSLHPAKLWLWDFDNNGSVEKIITRSVDGRDMTVALKKELTEQVTSLFKQNLTHSEFAGKSMQELFPIELLDKALVKEANWFKSSVAINNGNGEFTMQALPQPVQFSSVNAILSIDLNNDSLRDLVLGGNDSGFMPQYSRLDASFGHILINDGKGNYKKADNKGSGYFVKGDIRELMQLQVDGHEVVLTLINNKAPRMYNITQEGNDE